MSCAASVAPVAGAAGIASPVELVEYVGLAVATAGFGRRVAAVVELRVAGVPVVAASRAVAEAASRSVVVTLREFQSDSHSGIPSCCGSVAPEHCCFSRRGCGRTTGTLVVVVVVAGLAIVQLVNSSRVLAITSD